MHLTRSCCHSTSQYRGDILPKYQRLLKASKEKKEVLMNQRVSKRNLLQTSVHYDAEAISIYSLSSKWRKVSVAYSAESNWFGYSVEENTKGGKSLTI